MTYDEVSAMAEETGLPVAYDHFAEGESPDPPFMVFLFPRTDHFYADGKVYMKIQSLHFELYTDRKQPDVEAVVEAVLDRHEIVYDKTEVWIETEQLYEVLYTMEVIYETEDITKTTEETTDEQQNQV